MMSTDTKDGTCAVAVAPANALIAPSTSTLDAASIAHGTTNNGNSNSNSAHQTSHGKRPRSNNDDPNRDTAATTNNNNNNNSNPHRTKRRKRGKQQQSPPPQPEGCSVCKIVKDNEPPKYKCPKCRATYCSVACCRQHKLVCPGKEGSSPTKPAPTTTTSDSTKTTGTQSNPAAAAVKNGSASETDNDSDDDDDSSLEDGWKITDDMKNALRNSTWLRSELQDGGLRDMIASVVRSEKKHRSYHKQQQQNKGRNHRRHPKRNYNQPRDPHEELASKRTENRNFDVFVDKLSVLADVLERQDGPLDLGSENSVFAPVSSGGGRSKRDEKELEAWLRLKWDSGMAPPSLALKPSQKAIPKFEPVDVSSSDDDDDEDDGEDEASNPETNC